MLTMAGPGPIVADLEAENDDLDALVAPLAPQRWSELTRHRGGPSHTRSRTCCGPIAWHSPR
ncbi:hypothetical protein I551_0123 [Mycobacterium ulcerans str. Harvey]|uniref:Uncharacterized protein n=1 Tax=Mycobacterium ulcerans str. Harvey TaxID=1299332 RepID=A0ABP3ARU2_MYCUL|nr:hypothetical protein I551_0123 [Mycobacterium ulcerans str. Harvey]